MSKRQKKQPQDQIKKLKKKLDTFQSEVESLLRDVPSTDNLCVLCNNRKSLEYNDLPCHHVICHSCQREYKKLYCPTCQKLYHGNYEKETPSSSSSEEL